LGGARVGGLAPHAAGARSSVHVRLQFARALTFQNVFCFLQAFPLVVIVFVSIPVAYAYWQLDRARKRKAEAAENEECVKAEAEANERYDKVN